MRSVNKVILIGNVGRDPEVRYTKSGDPVLSFSLATTEKYKDREDTQWHRVSVFGKLAEAIKDYVAKGSPLYIEGQLVYEEWTDKDGVKRTNSNIKVGFNGTVNLLGGGKGDGAKRTAKKESAGSASGSGVEVPVSDDEIPF